jgi:hypothetical protein
MAVSGRGEKVALRALDGSADARLHKTCAISCRVPAPWDG